MNSRFAANLSALLLATASLAAPAAAHAQRLPGNARPSHYQLHLTPDLKAATFSGQEAIDLELLAPSKSITLNAAEIAFQKVSLTVEGQDKPLVATVSLDSSKEQATFTFPAEIPAGHAQLDITYTGILNDQLRGFYLSKTARRNYAVTQFEPTDARRAYPSFDEPAMKATYDVSLTVDANDTAISNSQIVSDKPEDNGKHTLRFATTPRMSTYLVAFLVGDFQCSKGESDGVAIRVCATPDKVAYTHFGVGITEEVLHYYNEYFGLPYPLKKLDLIALPDFEAGAMENLGAITYRETDLLADEKTASVETQKRVALVIAHEMAHQWFGDMVTMQWWDNLWLNEGFATWMENKSLVALHPEWKFDEEIADNINRTLNIDARPTTRSIRAKAETPAEINEMFDGIAYGKAGSVLQQIENYLGEETFRQGVHNYLAAHLFANATAEDFWGAQTENSHKPVDEIMKSLVIQKGEPILTFGSPKDGTISVEQHRFFLRPSLKDDAAQKWTIPVCFKTTSGQDCQILRPESGSLKIPAGSLFANAGGNGYYRSAYPDESFKQLVKTAENKLSPTERMSLVGDQWAEVQAGLVPVSRYLELAEALRNDQESQLIAQIHENLEGLSDRIAATPAERTALAAWVRKNFGPAYATLGAPAATDSPNRRVLRAELLELVGDLGNDAALQTQARSIADKYLANPASVDATLAHAALKVAAKHGDQALFDRLKSLYETSSSPELSEHALSLLVSFEDPALLDQALHYAASSKVRNQDAIFQFAMALRNPATREQGWKFITNNWTAVQAQLTTMAGGRLAGSTGNFCSASDHQAVAQFFATHPVNASERALRDALEAIDTCTEVRNLQEPKLKLWLKQ